MHVLLLSWYTCVFIMGPGVVLIVRADTDIEESLNLSEIFWFWHSYPFVKLNGHSNFFLKPCSFHSHSKSAMKLLTVWCSLVLIVEWVGNRPLCPIYFETPEPPLNQGAPRHPFFSSDEIVWSSSIIAVVVPGPVKCKELTCIGSHWKTDLIIKIIKKEKGNNY